MKIKRSLDSNKLKTDKIEIFGKDIASIDVSLKSRVKNLLADIRSEKNLLLGIFILLVFYSFAIFPNLIAPYDPIAISPQEALQPPSFTHVLGTDNYGRDIFSRIVYAARIDLLIAMGAVAFASTIGVTLGLTSGYFGGIYDTIVMRFLDAILAFPPLIFAILVIAFLGTQSLNLIFSIGVIFIPFFARVTRASVLGLRNIEYVQASKVSGAKNFSIMFRSILPNAMGPILVQTSLSLAVTLLVAASLSFLGLGVQPPISSWGTMLRESQSYLFAPWFVISPGACILLAVLAFNLIGDGMRDLIDPTMKLR